MIEFRYKNHLSDIRTRTVEPTSLDYCPLPNLNYGYQPGWFLTGRDFTSERDGLTRSFALTHIQFGAEMFINPSNARPYRLPLTGAGDDNGPLKALAWRVVALNPDAGEIGPGMLASLIADARKALK